MRYGHRAINKPVLDLIRNKVYITTHNHGYAVDPESIKAPASGYGPYSLMMVPWRA